MVIKKHEMKQKKNTLFLYHFNYHLHIKEDNQNRGTRCFCCNHIFLLTIKFPSRCTHTLDHHPPRPRERSSSPSQIYAFFGFIPTEARRDEAGPGRPFWAVYVFTKS